MLKTDFKDEILAPNETYRKYNIVDEGGRVIQSKVHLVRAYTPKQEGDSYGALNINELNVIVNRLKESALLIKDRSPEDL